MNGKAMTPRSRKKKPKFRGCLYCRLSVWNPLGYGGGDITPAVNGWHSIIFGQGHTELRHCTRRPLNAREKGRSR